MSYLDHSVNIIAYQKDNINYAMCCAWSMNVDYDKLLCLLGSQSVTGKNIKKGDIIGFSSLAQNQKDIAEKIGDNHSNTTDKLKGIKYHVEDGAILIDDSLSMIKCVVIDVLHLEEIEEDNLIYLKALDAKEQDGIFLHMSDF